MCVNRYLHAGGKMVPRHNIWRHICKAKRRKLRSIGFFVSGVKSRLVLCFVKHSRYLYNIICSIYFLVIAKHNPFRRNLSTYNTTCFDFFFLCHDKFTTSIDEIDFRYVFILFSRRLLICITLY